MTLLLPHDDNPPLQQDTPRHNDRGLSISKESTAQIVQDYFRCIQKDNLMILVVIDATVFVKDGSLL